MSLNAVTTATSITAAMSDFKTVPPVSYTGLLTDYLGPQASLGFLTILETILDDGFQTAVPSELNLDISVAAGKFSIPYTGGATSDMPKIIGKACADYWKLAIGKGTPVAQSVISSVSNNASGIATPIENNLRSLSAGVYITPHYSTFVDAIYKEVLNIKWVVSESGNSSSTFNVTVS